MAEKKCIEELKEEVARMVMNQYGTVSVDDFDYYIDNFAKKLRAKFEEGKFKGENLTSEEKMNNGAIDYCIGEL